MKKVYAGEGVMQKHPLHLVQLAFFVHASISTRRRYSMDSVVNISLGSYDEYSILRNKKTLSFLMFCD